MLQPDFKTVVLFLASPISGTFTVAAGNVLDVAGNASSAANVINGSVALPTTVALADNFTTADSASLNNDLLTRQSGLAATQSWASVQFNGADFSIFNNSISITNTGDTSLTNTYGVVYPNLDLRPYERYGSFHFRVKISPVVASGDSWGAVKVRQSDPSKWILNGDGLGIFVRPGGSWGVTDGGTVVFTGTVTPAATYAVDIEVVTNVLTAQINGTTIASGYTLSATQTMNYVSLMSNAGASAGGATGVAATFDDFEFSALGSYAGLPAAALVNPTYAAGTTSFQFSSVADVVYILEYKDDLLAPAWTSLGNLVGTGGTLTVNDTTAVAQRFYRLRVP
jgi:hypothetical protein